MSSGEGSSPFSRLYNRFSEWRTGRGLPNPGTVENLQKEVKSTLLSNYLFDGGRADLTKTLSANPLFQVTHSFALGSQVAPSSYNFGAIFAHEKLFLQGGLDHDGNLTARMNVQGFTPSHCTKLQAQIAQQAGHNGLSIEHDYQGLDYCLNFKAINPSPADLSGIYVGSYIQSITKKFALGAEYLHQNPNPSPHERTVSLMGKYTSEDKGTIVTALYQSLGVLQSTYWKKLSDKVEFAGDLSLLLAHERHAVGTIGAKYDLRMSTFRAQLDSTGKVSAVLEQRFTPAFTFLVSGEIDHWKNAAKVGVGVMIESSTLTPEDIMAQQPPML